jgi:hypothetical protein
LKQSTGAKYSSKHALESRALSSTCMPNAACKQNSFEQLRTASAAAAAVEASPGALPVLLG